MATPIERFSPTHLPAIRRFCERTWERPKDDAFYEWRYLEAPLQDGYLAVRDSEVLATLWAFRRPWRLGSETVHFLEVFDWFALPELQQAGLGVRALQAAMNGPDPCMLVGGTEQTRSLLPRLKWKIVGSRVSYRLPLGVREVARAISERTRAPGLLTRPAARLAVSGWFRPRPRRTAGARVLPTTGIGAEISGLYEGDAAWGTIPLWPIQQLRWLIAGHPSMGHFLPLYFAQGDELLGWSLVRIYLTDAGHDAELVELYATERDEELLAWMIAETASRLISFEVGFLRSSAACPVVQAAFERNRFQRVGEAPIQVWSKKPLELPEPMLVGSNTNDNPILPLPKSWW